MIFISFVNLRVVQKSEQVLIAYCIYKLSSDDKVLLSLIKKAWCTYTSLNISGKQISNNYAPRFNRIKFGVIRSYIELPCFSQIFMFIFQSWHRMVYTLGMNKFKQYFYSNDLHNVRKSGFPLILFLEILCGTCAPWC